MEFRVLGPVEVRHGDRVEVLSGRLRRTLLGVLLARANQPVPVDVLTDALWGDRPDPRAAQKLQLHVHRLRGVLDDPDRLSFGATGYQLRVRQEEIDAERFDALVTAGVADAETRPQRAIVSLRAALALWRGVPFADAEVSVLTDWARRLAERRLTAVESLYQAELACGLHEAVIGELTERVREHPLRERLHGLLMTALYRAGRRSEALEAYGWARHALASELGVEPGPELRELQRRVLAGDLPERKSNTRQSRREVPAQLPVDVRGFVAREDELAELDALLSSDAPVVISAMAGTAGVGKTALAVHWAHRVRDRFPDGQLYVDLRGYGPDEPVSPADAVAGFLRALGLEGAAIPEDLDERAARFRTLVDQRRMLILLDNARTVEQVRPLLPASSTCFTLVTSRDSLAGLVARYGAHRIELDRLSSAEAVGLLHELLGERADVEPEAVGALGERCARLPLALRVAAEIVRSRPGRAIGELAGELADQQDALDLLAADDPHTAVRAVFSWSYRQLDPTAARVFRLLGLHHGHDIDAYAIAAMDRTGVRETRRALDVLVRAHLVDRTAGGRYQPHDLLCAYAAELVERADDAAARDAAMTRLRGYYLATASSAVDVIAPHEADHRPKVAEPDTEVPVFDTYRAAFGWLDGERANLLAAVQHAEPRYVVAMSDTVWRYLSTGAYHDDALTLHTLALHAARTLGDAVAEANARRVIGHAMVWVGSPRQALDHLTQALALYRRAGDRLMRAATLNNIGIAHWRGGDWAESADSFRQALTLYREHGDRRLRVPAMTNLARVLCTLGQYGEASELFELALVITRDSGNRSGETRALCGLAWVSVEAGRWQEALDYARHALAIAQSTGNGSVECSAMRMLGVANHGLGEHELAMSQLTSALRIARVAGDTDQLTAALNELAAANASAGNTTEALGLYQEALTEDGHGHQDQYAHALAGMGDVRAALGRHEQAVEHWQRALVTYRRLGMPQADAVAARLDRPH